MHSDRLFCWVVAALIASLAPARNVLAQTTAPANDDRVVIIESPNYATPAAARAAWISGDRGSPRVELATVAGKPAIKLPCNFSINRNWRVAWDRVGKWDIAACQTVRLDMFVPGERAASLLIYLRSGQGWYSCHAAAAPGRSTVTLPRKKFGIEGKPAGWANVDCIRVSVLWDESVDREVMLCGIDAVASPAFVAIYRNDVGAKAEPGYSQCTQQMADRLDRLNVAYEILNDDAVAAGRLAGKKVAILPLNPVLPAPAGAALETFVADGGRLMVFYCLPDPLPRLLGVRPVGAIRDADKLRCIEPMTTQPDERRIRQESWIATRVKLDGADAEAWWADRKDHAGSEPALTRNRNGYFVGHVLTSVDQSDKDALVQFLVGDLWPGLWEGVYKARLTSLGRVAGFANVDEAFAAAKANAADRDVAKSLPGQLEHIQQLRESANAAAARGDFRRASDLVVATQQYLLAAYAATVPCKPREFRAVWCHDPAGVADMTWDQATKRLADAGFNAIIPNMCWGDSAAYPSKVLQRTKPVDRDLLAECIAAAKKHNIAVHVWRVNWNLAWLVDSKRKAELRAAGRLQQGPKGEPVDWLCPSNPMNRQQEIDAMVEIARNYDVAGIHFDYIRYPGHDSCYCPVCRAEFEKQTGQPVKHWSADVTEGPLRDRFLQFRRDNITRVVAGVSEQARKVRPGLKISAAVFWQWNTARDQVGQDWRLWIRKGYVDFVCPMQYTDSAAMFDSQTQQTLGWAGGKVPVYPGIGATLGIEPDGTLEQVLAARKRGATGFVLFNYDRALLDDLDLLRLGATNDRKRE